MMDEEKVMAYVNRLIELENQLASIGHSLSDKDKIRSLLRGLSSDFEVTAKVIRAMDFSFTKAVSELVIGEGSKRKESTDVSGSATGLATVHQNSNTKKPSCTHCGRLGHRVSDCYHNPSSKSYRKGYRGKPKWNHKPKSQARKFAVKDNSTGQGEYNSDVAMISKSVLSENTHIKKPMRQEWMVDSASTSHICNDKSHFETLRRTPCKTVEVGEGQLVTVEGIGSVKGVSITEGGEYRITFKAVLYVPTMICNLISMSRARRSGFRVIVDSDDNNNGYCHIIHKVTNLPYVEAWETPEGMYAATFQPCSTPKAFVSAENDIWHQRMAHVSHNTLKKTASLVHGMNLENHEENLPKCESCMKGECAVAIVVRPLMSLKTLQNHLILSTRLLSVPSNRHPLLGTNTSFCCTMTVLGYLWSDS